MAKKHLVVGVDWYGPYSLEQAQTVARSYGKGGLYLCLGKRKRQHQRELQYIGKSNDGLRSRLHKDHHKLRLVTREVQFWLGIIATGSVPGRRLLLTPRALQLAEWAIAHFLKLPLNDKMRTKRPPGPVTVLSRWWANEDQERPRKHRPHPHWPDLIDYLGPDYRARIIWFGSPGRLHSVPPTEF